VEDIPVSPKLWKAGHFCNKNDKNYLSQTCDLYFEISEETLTNKKMTNLNKYIINASYYYCHPILWLTSACKT